MKKSSHSCFFLLLFKLAFHFLMKSTKNLFSFIERFSSKETKFTTCLDILVRLWSGGPVLWFSKCSSKTTYHLTKLLRVLYYWRTLKIDLSDRTLKSPKNESKIDKREWRMPIHFVNSDGSTDWTGSHFLSQAEDNIRFDFFLIW